ncbi:hypothetical protein [Psychromarinibacter halotolerans]|uniref:Uncharacterized protein n=1 Tax=Psychromarinibacter halotolerans TaxID=1775175 RepID=A0ABV7GZF5_9RHOB|nr:hypothetical protein [Psychromarinibacter halotolerans]MDF0596322.1 hypothetical protein [Psychromarinibacter halotolerans]
MTKKNYTATLNGYYAEKLERLAKFHGKEDIDAYAEKLLQHAIEESEIWMHSEMYLNYRYQIIDFENEQEKIWGEFDLSDLKRGEDIDDDLPF